MQEVQNVRILEAKIAIIGTILIAPVSRVVVLVVAATSVKAWVFIDLLPSKKVPTKAVASPVVIESNISLASALSV